MAIKYKLKLRDLKLEYLIEYFKPILKYLKTKEKIDEEFGFQERGEDE